MEARIVTEQPNSFPPSIHSQLGYYVYLYLDPRNNEIFYVGKGKGNRAFSHLFEESEKEKVKRFKAIRTAGYEPVIQILIHGIEDEQTALRIEASVIDILESRNLTNIQKGYHSRSFGRMAVDQLIALYSPKHTVITDPIIAFKINKTFRFGMSPTELYDYTRHSWNVGLRRNLAKYAFSLYRGVVQEVYEIEKWLPQNTTPNTKHTKEIGDHSINTERLEFIGRIAPQNVRSKYYLKDISEYLHSNQAPYEYINC